MISLLRDDVSVPNVSAFSSTMTSLPASPSRRATAKPTAPAPITTHSTRSTIKATRPSFDEGYRLRAIRCQPANAGLDGSAADDGPSRYAGNFFDLIIAGPVVSVRSAKVSYALARSR